MTGGCYLPGNTLLLFCGNVGFGIDMQNDSPMRAGTQAWD